MNSPFAVTHSTLRDTHNHSDVIVIVRNMLLTSRRSNILEIRIPLKLKILLVFLSIKISKSCAAELNKNSNSYSYQNMSEVTEIDLLSRHKMWCVWLNVSSVVSYLRSPAFRSLLFRREGETTQYTQTQEAENLSITTQTLRACLGYSDKVTQFWKYSECCSIHLYARKIGRVNSMLSF